MITDHVAGRLSELDRVVVQAVPPGGNWRDLPEDFPSKRIEQIRRGAAAGDGTRSTYYGRLRWDRPSYTVSTFFSRPGNGCYIHPSAPRLITLREAARLQTFPDWYRFIGQGRSRFIQIGNAVPPLLAFQLARIVRPTTFVDLFSGAGGLSLGFDWAGAELLAAVDIDKSSNTTFRQNNPRSDSVIDADLADTAEHQVVIKEILRRAGSEGVDVVAGGPPCQGFSTAGNCRLDDPRNRLVHTFVAAVEALQPRVVIMENVAALLWKRRQPILQEVRKSFHNLGYNTSVILAHAEGYGVPQLRRRVLLLGTRTQPISWPLPWRQVVPPSYLQYQPGAESAQSDMPRPYTVRDAIGDLPDSEAESADEEVEYASPATTPLQRLARGNQAVDDLLPPPILFEATTSAVEEPLRFF